MRCSIGACLAALLLVPSCTAAVPFTGTFTQTGTSYMVGEANIQAAGPVFDLGLAPGTELTINSLDSWKMEFSIEEVRAALPLLQPASAWSRDEPTISPLGSGRVGIMFSGANASVLRFLPTQSAIQLGVAGNSEVRPPGSWTGLDAAFALQHVQAFGNVDVHPSTDGSTARTTGNLSVVLASGYLIADGPSVTIDGAEIQTGYRHEEANSLQDPFTGSGRKAYAGTLVMLKIDGARFDCESCVAITHISTLAGTLAGRIRWHGIEGQNQLNNETLPRDLELMETGGEYSWEVRPSGSALEWHVHGDSLWIKTEGIDWWREGAAPVAASLMVLTLLAIWVGWFKGLATFVLGRHGPRLVKAPLLENATRHQILEAIHAQQPATLARLQESTGLSRGTLRYHLRILESHDVLQSILPKGHQRRDRSFMLNSGSLMFKDAGLGLPCKSSDEQPMAGRILSGVNSDNVRHALLELLLQRGSMTFEQLRDALIASGTVAKWPRSTASYQLKKLVASKAIRERRAGLAKVYHAEIDPALARSKQYTSYFIQSGNAAIADALSTGPKTLEELQSILDHRIKLTNLKWRLKRLEGLALLRKDGESRYALASNIHLETIP